MRKFTLNLSNTSRILFLAINLAEKQAIYAKISTRVVGECMPYKVFTNNKFKLFTLLVLLKEDKKEASDLNGNYSV